MPRSWQKPLCLLPWILSRGSVSGFTKVASQCVAAHDCECAEILDRCKCARRVKITSLHYIESNASLFMLTLKVSERVHVVCQNCQSLFLKKKIVNIINLYWLTKANALKWHHWSREKAFDYFAWSDNNFHTEYKSENIKRYSIITQFFVPL